MHVLVCYENYHCFHSNESRLLIWALHWLWDLQSSLLFALKLIFVMIFQIVIILWSRMNDSLSHYQWRDRKHLTYLFKFINIIIIWKAILNKLRTSHKTLLLKLTYNRGTLPLDSLCSNLMWDKATALLWRTQIL